MKIVKPSVEILHINSKALELIEKAGRTCYKSEDKITSTSAGKFAKRRVQTGHESVIEHSMATVKFICDRGISHEIVRHRLASYCLSGDSKILRYAQGRGHLTIKELYNRQQDGQLRGRNSLMLLRSMNEDNKIVPNSFKKVLYSGKKDMYRVTTALGYSIKTSKDHIFFTPTGDTQLRNLNVGDEVFVNGIELIKDIEWLASQRDMGISIQDIADKTGVSYSTVRKYIRFFGLTKPLGNKPNNFNPWNKGLNEDDDFRVKIQADALRNNHHNNDFGNKNSCWKEDVENMTESGLRQRFTKYPKIVCECCGSAYNLENHHRDKDVTNWRETNKITLCMDCHKTYHKGYNVKHVLPDEIVSVEYVGLEDSYDIEMNEPFHNFVADGFVVHNSQESTRYCDYEDGHVVFILPKLLIGIENQFGDNDVWDGGRILRLSRVLRPDHPGIVWLRSMAMAENSYKKLRNKGWGPQWARSVLPNSLKTEIVMTANFREWRHFFRMRTSKAAHPQMREIAIPLLAEMKKRIPNIFDDMKVENND